MNLLHKAQESLSAWRLWIRKRPARTNAMNDLLTRHRQLVSRLTEVKDNAERQQIAEKAIVFCGDVVAMGVDVGDEVDREVLYSLLSEWSSRIFDLSGEYPKFTLASYAPPPIRDIRRFISTYRYFIFIVLASIMSALGLILGPDVVKYFTRPIISIEVSQNTIVCTPGQVGCLFTVNVSVQRPNGRMRAYLLSKVTGPIRSGWIKSSEGVTIESTGVWKLTAQIGGFSSPVQPEQILEVIAVLFQDPEPLANSQFGLIFEDFYSLPGLVSASSVVQHEIRTAQLSEIVPNANPLGHGKIYGFEQGSGVFRIGYEVGKSLLSSATITDGTFLRMQYTALPETFGVWGIYDLKGLNPSTFNGLAFGIRGSIASCDLVIKLKDSPRSVNSEEAQVKLSQYAMMSTTWTTAVIPLVDFLQSQPGLNWATLNVLTFGFNAPLGNCDIDVKDLQWVHRSELPDLPPSNLLPLISTQLAKISSAQLYSSPTVPSHFVVEARINTRESSKTDYVLHIVYTGRTKTDFGVSGIQNLDRFNAAEYRALSFDARGNGEFVVKQKDRFKCESAEYAIKSLNSEQQTFILPLSSFIGSGCRFDATSVDVITFGFKGLSQVDVSIDNIQFVK